MLFDSIRIVTRLRIVVRKEYKSYYLWSNLWQYLNAISTKNTIIFLYFSKANQGSILLCWAWRSCNNYAILFVRHQQFWWYSLASGYRMVDCLGRFQSNCCVIGNKVKVVFLEVNLMIRKKLHTKAHFEERN